MQRSRSDELKRQEEQVLDVPLVRRHSGGKTGPVHFDCPSFSLGPEFDIPDYQPGPSITPGVETPDWDADIDPEEIERMCVEAENARKTLQHPPGSEQKQLSPSSYETPRKDPQQADLDPSSGGTRSSSAPPQQHARRIIKAPICKKSPYINVDTLKKFACTPEINKLYALVVQHVGRSIRNQNQEEERSVLILFT